MVKTILVQFAVDTPAQFNDFLAYLKEEGWKWRMYSALVLLGDRGVGYTIYAYTAE